MILDTSAIYAVLLHEQDARTFAEAIRRFRVRRVSAASYVELGLVIDRFKDPIASRRVDEFLAEIGAIIEPVTASQAVVARDAHRDFGRGSGHPARLNYGDCFAYALAIDKNEPLLFKGTDFGQTDVRSAFT